MYQCYITLSIITKLQTTQVSASMEMKYMVTIQRNTMWPFKIQLTHIKK